MSKKKVRSQDGARLAISNGEVSAQTPVMQEPTMKDWHSLVNFALEDEPEMKFMVQFLLLSSPTGRAYLERITRVRPDLGAREFFDYLEMVYTFEGLELLDQLIAEPRCGTDPEFYIWKDIWKDCAAGPSHHYTVAISLAMTLEEQAGSDDERARIRVVREVIERELYAEQYRERKRELMGPKK